MRIFGDSIDSVIDREYELKVIARLSFYDLGPKLEGFLKMADLKNTLRVRGHLLKPTL